METETIGVAITGPKRSGKDTAYKAIVEELDKLCITHRSIRFVDPLHDSMEILYPGWKDRWEEYKDVHDELLGCTPRELIIRVSAAHTATNEYAITNSVIPYVNAWCADKDVDVIIFMDLGFDRETAVLEELFDKLVYVQMDREGCAYDENDNRSYQESDKALTYVHSRGYHDDFDAVKLKANVIGLMLAHNPDILLSEPVEAPVKIGTVASYQKFLAENTTGFSVLYDEHKKVGKSVEWALEIVGDYLTTFDMLQEIKDTEHLVVVECAVTNGVQKEKIRVVGAFARAALKLAVEEVLKWQYTHPTAEMMSFDGSIADRIETAMANI